jgi:hypothetical protein
MTTAHVDPFDHPALFYRDDREYLAGTLPFIADGLAAGAPATSWAATPSGCGCWT